MKSNRNEGLRALSKMAVFVLVVWGFVTWLAWSEDVGFWLTFSGCIWSLLAPYENDRIVKVLRR